MCLSAKCTFKEWRPLGSRTPVTAVKGEGGVLGHQDGGPGKASQAARRRVEIGAPVVKEESAGSGPADPPPALLYPLGLPVKTPAKKPTGREKRMPMKLYGAVMSPFDRKTRVVLAPKGLDYEAVHVDPNNKPEGYEKISPLQRIPGAAGSGRPLSGRFSGDFAPTWKKPSPEPAPLPQRPVPVRRAPCGSKSTRTTNWRRTAPSRCSVTGW